MEWYQEGYIGMKKGFKLGVIIVCLYIIKNDFNRKEKDDV